MKKTNLIHSRSEYTKSYSDIRGVDLSGNGSNISERRLAYAENMYRDYDSEGGGVIESIPGFRKILSLGQKINGIYCQKCYNGKDYILVHSGTKLYRFALSDKDSIGTLSSIGALKNTKSRGFSFGGCYYILDGIRIVRIDEDGTFSTLGSGDTAGYIPTLYVNGSQYEQRNLLTNLFYEEMMVSDPYKYSYGTPALRYVITDSELRYCAVSGIDEGYSGDVFIPSYKDIGGIVYQVKSISEYAFFQNTAITSVRICEGLEKIGKYAFMRASSLTDAYLPMSITEIDNGAFAECEKLSTLYLGAQLKRIGIRAFDFCDALTQIHYGAGTSEFSDIDIEITDFSYEIIYNSVSTDIRVRIPVYSDAAGILSVRIDGTGQLYTTEKEGTTIKAIILILKGDWLICNKTVRIEGTLQAYSSSFSGSSSDFLITEAGKSIGGFDAITKCTVAEVFDGRVFLAGNPSLPNTVFYSQRDKTGENNPLYFGVMNYFNDGAGSYPVVSMLAVRDALAVFKSGDDGSGSIFYHTPTETNNSLIPKIYPCHYVHSGICALGESLSFLDDPVFVTQSGISALEQKNINYERSIGCRSHNVNFDLLKQELRNVTLTEWLGYLAVGVNGTIYLADSRAMFTHETGSSEYEWFVLRNIGTYKNPSRVYRYASTAPKGYSISDSLDEICYGAVYSVRNESGELVYYTPLGNEKYTVYPTEQMRKGVYSPAVAFIGVDNLLFFGTESGDICLFNNDKRGIAPQRLSEAADFDAEEYASKMGRLIHPDFYTFDTHAPRYAIKTKLDDCGIPHLTKNTSKHSLVIKCKSYSGNKIHVEAGTDKSGYKEVTVFPGGGLDFSELSFANFSIDLGEYFTLPIAEKEKDWIEKQITVYSDSFRSPIGIYSITYRYTVKGKIKKR